MKFFSIKYIVSYSDGTNTKCWYVCDPEYKYSDAKRLQKIKSNSGINHTRISLRISFEFPIFKQKRDDAVFWNEYNQVVQSHRDGTIDIRETNIKRDEYNLPPFKFDNKL